jgi:hypothetical protein
MEGAAAMKSREGKLTLPSCKVAAAPLPKVDSQLIRDTRKRLRCLRAVFARRLRINERTWKTENKAVRSRILGRRLSSLSVDTQIRPPPLL